MIDSAVMRASFVNFQTHLLLIKKKILICPFVFFFIVYVCFAAFEF